MKKIVMIDQDGTVCDRKYQVTTDIMCLVKNLIQTGIKIVPNSDTPIVRLACNFQKMLGFNPEIVIGEKGAVVKLDGQFIFLKNISGIQSYIVNLKKVFSNFGSTIYVGDSATWIRNGKLFKPNTRIIIIDGMRQQSIAFYFRITDSNGLPQINENWSQEALVIARDLVLPKGLSSLDYNKKYGIAIANVEGVDKTDGYKVLRKYYSNEKFFMIGDGDIDIINDKDVVHCAVANASETLKRHSKFVANLTYTEGLKECLMWIIKK